MLLNAKAIGAKIRQIRKIEQQKTQEQFAEFIDSSARTISNIETGKTIPDIQTLANIAEQCNVSINEILGIEEHKDETYISIENGNHKK